MLWWFCWIWVRITLNFGTSEIVTWLRRVSRFLPDGLRHMTKQKGQYVASITHKKYFLYFLYFLYRRAQLSLFMGKKGAKHFVYLCTSAKYWVKLSCVTLLSYLFQLIECDSNHGAVIDAAVDAALDLFPCLPVVIVALRHVANLESAGVVVLCGAAIDAAVDLLHGVPVCGVG